MRRSFFVLIICYTVNMKKGKFIVIEGGEGSGKGTQLDLLKKELSGMDILYTREPGGTRISELIRDILLNKENTEIVQQTELLLFYASRAQLVKELIAPALEAGKNVISDRFSLSTIAYQIYGRERQEYLSFCESLDAEVVGKYIPDLTVFLDIEPVRGLERVRAKRPDKVDRLDLESVAFHNRVRDGYLRGLKKVSHTIINADRSPEEVFVEFGRVVKACLGA